MTAAILDHLWQSTLVAILIGVLSLLFRNNSAGMRYWLWFAASVKFLVPFSLLAAIGRVGFTHAVPASSLQVLARIEPAATPFAAAAALPDPHQIPWAVVAAAIWMIGFVTLAAFWLMRARTLSAIVRAATPLALDVPISVVATPELLEPGLVGIVRPVILLPENLARRLSGVEIDAILAHELCHLRRRDNLLAMIHMLVEGIFWFHPLVWFIGARLVEERELACDEAVLGAGKKPLDYAQAILKVCRLCFPSPLPCAAGVSGADLDRRITAIMTTRDADEVDPRKILLLAGLGALAVLTPLVTGGLKPAPAAQLVQNLAQMLAPVEQAGRAEPVRDAPATARPRAHRTAPHRYAASAPLKTVVAAPAIDASTPIIIIPLPQLATDTSPAETAPAEAEAPVCRPPQRLTNSRFMGPQVCLPGREWDRLKAQGLMLMPDGHSLAPDYQKLQAQSSIGCKNPAGVRMGSASTALGTLSVGCYP